MSKRAKTVAVVLGLWLLTILAAILAVRDIQKAASLDTGNIDVTNLDESIPEGHWTNVGADLSNEEIEHISLTFSEADTNHHPFNLRVKPSFADSKK